MIVFFDFDNTITTKDVIDDMLARFSVDQHWEKLEKEWKNGRIGSRKCLSGQMRGIRIKKNRLDSYLASVKIDPYFKRLLRLFKDSGIKVIILSDDFNYILKKVFAHHGIRNIKILANKLCFRGEKLFPRFPFSNKACYRCAHCKKKNLLENSPKSSIIVYIGDGQSDACAAACADLVFAKKGLLKHLKEKRKKAILFKGLREVYAYFHRG